MTLWLASLGDLPVGLSVANSSTVIMLKIDRFTRWVSNKNF